MNWKFKDVLKVTQTIPMVPNSANSSIRKNDPISGFMDKQIEGRRTNEELSLNLAVYGASAPMYLQERKPDKEIRSVRNQRSVKKEFKRMEAAFPIDKIIFLAEKLQMSESNSQKIEYISEVEVLSERKSDKTSENKSSEFMISQNGASREGSCFSSARSSKEKTKDYWLSPDLNFSIDLSSLSNTNDESDGSENDFKEPDSKASLAKTNEDEQYDSCLSSRSAAYSCRYEYKSSRGSFSKYSNKECAIRKSSCIASFRRVKEDTHNFETFNCPKSPERNWSATQIKVKTCDMIGLYVNAMDNQKDLNKYFRPCRVCKEVSCLCESYQDSQGNLSNSLKSLLYCRLNENGDVKEKNCHEISKMVNKAVETDVSVTKFEKSCCENPDFFLSCPFVNIPGKETSNGCYSYRSCPEPLTTFYKSCCSKSELERRNFLRSHTCCCDCACDVQLDFLNNSVNSSPEPCSSAEPNAMLTYASSLANAARSARILARDLESVLSTFKTETDRRNN